MIISHLICEANGKTMPTLSKQNTQTDYVAIQILLVAICQDFVFLWSKVE
jgi:hypothetical protein